ncbi:rho GTPase-activating protein 30 [Anolis sagrei]|uniref:rho GTPase-activating protein 30 n=1 Tax=Anolis sagrei TaxID=38937 RepID=UPI003521A8EB
MSLAMKARQKVKRKAAAKDRVFGCDLVEHLQSSGHDVPQVLKSCTEFVEHHGIVDGIYRLSGVSSNIQKLRLEFDTERTPDLNKDVYLQDIHCVSSLCKAYFRELPNPLLTYQLYDKFAEAVAIQLEEGRLEKIKEVLKELPPPHYRTLEFLMKHLVRMASFSPQTNMHVRNLAIVWAPNLLRSKDIETSGFNGTAAFMEVRIQSIVVEFILTHVEQIFGDAPLRGGTRESLRKSLLLMGSPLPLADEKCCFSYNVPTMLNQGDGPPQMRPYHTIIELSDSKRKGSLKGKKWKSIFNLGRYSQDAKRKFIKTEDKDYKSGKLRLRPAKSMDSLSSVPCAGDDEADLGRKTSQKKLLTLGRESFDGPASLDISFLSSGECPEKAKVEAAVVSKSEEEGESATAKSEPTTPKTGRSGALGSSNGSPRQGRSPKSGRNRAEKCLGVHISGPLSVTVPFHITSNLTLSRLTRGLECPALSHCATPEEEKEGSSKDTQDTMTIAAAAAEDRLATEAKTSDSDENRMSMEVQDSFSFLDTQEAWLEEPQKSPFGGPVEDDVGTGIMNQIIGGGMQLDLFSSLPPLNYLSIEECMNEHSEEEDDQYYLAMACPDGKEADPEEVYLSAFDDLSPLANEAKQSDERREEEDRSTDITGGSPLVDSTDPHFFGRKARSHDLPDYCQHPDRTGKEPAVLPTCCLESTNPTAKESAVSPTCLPESTDRIRKESAIFSMSCPESTNPTGKESAVFSKCHPESTNLTRKESAVFSTCRPESTNLTRKESAVFSKCHLELTDPTGTESAVFSKCHPELTNPTGKESAVFSKCHPELTNPTGKESAVSSTCRPESTNLTRKESAVSPTCLPESTNPTGKESAVFSKCHPELTNPTGKESAVFSKCHPESTNPTGKESAVFSKCHPELTNPTGKESAVFSMCGPESTNLTRKESAVLSTCRPESTDPTRKGTDVFSMCHPELTNLTGKESAVLSTCRPESTDPTRKESSVFSMCRPELTDPTGKESSVFSTSFPESNNPTRKESAVFSMCHTESTDRIGKEPAVSPNPNCHFHESTKLEKESLVLEARNRDDLQVETTEQALRECLPKPTGLETASPSLEGPQNEQKMDLTKSSECYIQLSHDDTALLWIEDLDPSLVEHLTTFDGHLSTSLGQSSEDYSSVPDDVCLHGGSIEPDVVSLEDLLPKTHHEAPKAFRSKLSDGSVHMRLTSSTVRVQQVKSFPVIPPKPHFARIPPSMPKNPAENGSVRPASFDARYTAEKDINNMEEESFGFVPDSFKLPATSVRFQKQRNSMPGTLEKYIGGEAEIWKGNNTECPLEKHNLSANVYSGEDLHPMKSFMAECLEHYGDQRRTSEPSQNPIEGQWRADGTMDPSQNPIEGQRRADGTTDPSQNPIEGQRRADGATDPSRNPIEGQQRADGATAPSRNPIEGQRSTDGATDPSRNPREGQRRADGTTVPSQNPIEGQQRADGTTDPSPKFIEGLSSVMKHHGTTDPSRNPIECQQRADRTTDPSPKPIEGLSSALKHHGTTDPSPNPIEGRGRAEASPQRRAQWRNNGGSTSFDEAVALAKERQGGQAAMRRMKTYGGGEDGVEKKAVTTTLQRKPALKLSRPQSCVGPSDVHLGVKLASPDGQVAFDPEVGRSSAKGRRLSLSEEAL